MNTRRSEQHVALRSSDMGLILYVAVVPLFAMLLVYQIYASPNTPFVDTIHNHSILTILSPVELRPTIIDVLESILSLSSRTASIKLPSASELISFCLTILKRESLAFTAHWTTDKLFAYEISYVITIGATSFFTKFFHVAYLRAFISTVCLLVSLASNFKSPKEHNSPCAARQQFKYKICAFCCVIFTAIDYIAFIHVGTSSARDAVHGLWEGKMCCCTWCMVRCIAPSVGMVVAGLFGMGRFTWDKANSVLESWLFVKAAREKEAARSGVDADGMERVVNAMKQSGRFMEDEREEQMRGEALREIIGLYETDETQVKNTKQPESPRAGCKIRY